jgi:PAS domain S-box-containing protein
MTAVPPAASDDPAEAPYRQLFEQNVAVQLVVEPTTGAIVDANRAAADFYGYSREALVTRSVTELAALPDDDVLQTLEVAAELGAHLYAFPHRHASGALRLVEIYAGPLSLHGRSLVHMIVHDVTERVRAEDAARELHAERVGQQCTVEARVAAAPADAVSHRGVGRRGRSQVRNPFSSPPLDRCALARAKRRGAAPFCAAVSQPAWRDRPTTEAGRFC